ncbi:MAG: acylphosphatase [Alcaligenaceae bacterium]|nr:acylphosphatase [Alcaligenaceae bacterium]
MVDGRRTQVIQPLHFPESPVETLTVTIRGRVQGVGFRVATVRQAHALQVCGWVRNQPDGSVQALLQGTPDALDRLLSWFHIGPPGAQVHSVEHQQLATGRLFERFEVN